MSVRHIFLLITTVVCAAQEFSAPELKPGEIPTFGVTVFSSSGFKGDIYLLPQGTAGLPNFKKLKPIGSIYTTALNVPPRLFTAGFPGVTGQKEWFAIDYNARFWITKPGRYQFGLLSDDGSKLYIDGKRVIDNDGNHPPTAVEKGIQLREGVHEMRVSYYQGPGDSLALVLGVLRPGEVQWKIFDTDEFAPPAGTATSK